MFCGVGWKTGTGSTLPVRVVRPPHTASKQTQVSHWNSLRCKCSVRFESNYTYVSLFSICIWTAWKLVKSYLFRHCTVLDTSCFYLFEYIINVLSDPKNNYFWVLSVFRWTTLFWQVSGCFSSKDDSPSIVVIDFAFTSQWLLLFKGLSLAQVCPVDAMFSPIKSLSGNVPSSY